MYRIAIGDDDPVFLKELEECVCTCLVSDGLERDEDFQLTAFRRPEALLEALLTEGKSVQLLLLDIEFGTANGLELAARLRERDGGFSLIYITTHDDYVFDSFDTRPLHYLLKPLQTEKLAALLREDYRRQTQDDRLNIKSGGRYLSLPFGEIYAVESCQHSVLLHTPRGVVKCPGPLSALAPKLPRWRFCQCHFSFFVNVAHIVQLTRAEVMLDNGERIPVSRRFYRSAFDQYLSFLQR